MTKKDWKEVLEVSLPLGFVGGVVAYTAPGNCATLVLVMFVAAAGLACWLRSKI